MNMPDTIPDKSRKVHDKVLLKGIFMTLLEN